MKKKASSLKLLLFSATTLLLTGCAAGLMVGSSLIPVSENTLKEKAAFALGKSKESITISNQSQSAHRTNFTATVNGTPYRCYVTSTSAIVSQAICDDADGNPATSAQQCNALLRAAGRC